MSVVSYPDNVLPSVREVIDIVRQGEMVTRKAEFALHAWNVQGYVQGYALGNPNLPVGSEEADTVEVDFTDLNVSDEEACCDALVAMFPEAEEDSGTTTGFGSGPSGAINPAVAMWIISLLNNLLSK